MKPWKDMTEEEINENKQKQCRFCTYAKYLCRTSPKEESAHNMYCGFTEDTGRMRICSPINCVEFKRKTGKRKKVHIKL